MKHNRIKVIFVDIVKTLGIFMVATALCYLLDYFHVNELNFIIIYVLGILLTAIVTSGYAYSSVLSVVSVLAYDFCFTVPRLTFHFHDRKYIVTFILMFAVGIIVSALMFQFKKRMTEIARLNVEKEKLKGEAEKEQLKATLLRSISHDLRTPLTTIKNGAEVLLDNEDLDVAERNNVLGDIEYKANWTIRLVENLLSLSRIDNEHLSVHKSDEAVEEIVPEAVRSIGGILENRHIHYDMPEEFMLVPMDATLIIETIGNILVNAVRHTASDGNIWIKVFDSGKNAVFRISNDGEPIGSNDIDHIFEMYYTDMHNKKDRGVGLGLPICKLIIAAHGGKICARNTDNGRVQFEFTLPMEVDNGEHFSS